MYISKKQSPLHRGASVVAFYISIKIVVESTIQKWNSRNCCTMPLPNQSVNYKNPSFNASLARPHCSPSLIWSYRQSAGWLLLLQLQTGTEGRVSSNGELRKRDNLGWEIFQNDHQFKNIWQHIYLVLKLHYYFQSAMEKFLKLWLTVGPYAEHPCNKNYFMFE
jgi:hypothetical protein